MRRSTGGVIVAALMAAATAVAVATGPDVATAVPAEPYTWKNVRLDGGGFVPGSSRDWGNGAVLRSTGEGNAWSRAYLPVEAGGGMPGRGAGERLAVDPRDNRKVHFAAGSGNGLRRSTDHGAACGKAADPPNAGNHVADPSDPNGCLSRNQGLTWVTFDPASPAVYVGVAEEENTVPAGWACTATRSGTAVSVVNATSDGTRTSGISTTVGFPGSTTGTTHPVPSPITCSTNP